MPVLIIQREMALCKKDMEQPVITKVGHYHVTIRPCIGKGAFGIVYEAEHETSGDVLAAKELNYEGLTRRQKAELLELTKCELSAMRKLQNHPYIVSLKDHFEYENSYWIIMELCDKGNLKQCLEENGDLSLQRILHIMHQTSNALCFMHSQNPAIIHSNIKLENILLKDVGQQPVAKLCDFAFANIYDKYAKMSTVFKNAPPMESSSPFVAPEFSAKLDGGLKCTTAADVFSLGLVFQVMLNPNREDYNPVSIEARKAGVALNVGLEMMQCFKEGKPLPTVIESFPRDDNVTKRVKRIIKNMTKFHISERRVMGDIEEELAELVEEFSVENITQGLDKLTHKVKSETACARANVSNPPSQSPDTVKVCINHLSFEEGAPLYQRETVSKLFVEYRLLNIDPEETETPQSLPKPPPNKVINFNFNKVFRVDHADQHERRQYLASMLLPDHPLHGKIKFTVVSDPGDLDGECEDVGKSYVSVRDILRTGRDLEDKDIKIVDPENEAAVIGKLNVTVKCVDALRSVQAEMEQDSA